jgi:taurine dioxygenase
MRPVSQSFGVEILEVDLSQAQPDSVRDAIVGAWREHHLILLRDQELSVDDHLRFAEWFGTIRPPDKFVHPELGDRGTHSHLSNTREHGTGGTAEVMRHQDFTWTVPLRAISLYAIEVPDTGGDTIFFDSEAAVDRLDPELRAQAAAHEAIHFDRYASGRANRSAEPLESRLPVLLPHPTSGRPILFVNEQTVKTLVGDGDTDALLQRLLATFDQPSLQYTHRWRAGDVIVWDNLSLQHARTAFPDSQARTLRRVQID